MSSIFSSRSSPASPSSGGVYTFKLYIYIEVDSLQGKEYSMTNEEFGRKLADNKFKKWLDPAEEIDEVSYYTHPLNSWQIGKGVMYHAFIVLKTKDWYWSIEKNDAGVTIQRSKEIEYVRGKYYRVKRQESLIIGITEVLRKSVTHLTMKQLIEHIHNDKYVDEEYSILQSNCQKFAFILYSAIDTL